jgi:geranylgeranyl pyrophosphate synthase
MNEKDDLLAAIENLEESLKQKDEELQEQNSRYEEVYALENEKEELQNKCVELEEKNAEFVSEKERACEIIKELQERR